MELKSYLNECLQDNKLIRWPGSAMPLKFYIAPFRWYKAKDESYQYKQMVIDALNLWKNASSGKVSFEIVNTINESQINLDWRRVDRNSLGHCYFNFDNQSRLYSAEIQIGLSDGILHSAYQDKGEVFHTVIHEIGHALGLGHSPYKNDIMYVPHQYGINNLSLKDKCTLKWLYTFSYGVNVNEFLSEHKLPVGYNIDNLIMSLEDDGNKQDKVSEFKDYIYSSNGLNLDSQQQILANMNKFNMALQNINISENLQKNLKKINFKKNIK